MARAAENEKKVPAFSHAAAVATARHDYPEETESVTFVDLSEPDAKEKIFAWMVEATPELRAAKEADDKETLAGLDAFINEIIWGELGYSLVCNGQALLASRGKIHAEQLEAMPLFRNADSALWHVFSHELGHILVPNGHIRVDDDASTAAMRLRNRAEGAADGFAWLYNLHHGRVTVDEMAAYASGLVIAVCQSIEHMTTFTLDKMMAGMSLADIEALSKEGIVALAQQQSEAHALKGLALLELRSALTTEGKTAEQWLENVSSICRQSPENSAEFYISTRILSEVFKMRALPQGVEGNVDFADAKWNGLRAKTAGAHLA